MKGHRKQKADLKEKLKTHGGNRLCVAVAATARRGRREPIKGPP